MTAYRQNVVAALLTLLAGFFVLPGCRSQNTVHSTRLDSLAKERAGPAPIPVYNDNKTYVLYKEAEDSASYTSQSAIRYVIFRLKDNEVVLEGKFTRGYVKWINNTLIEVLSVPEKVKPGADLAVYKRQVYIEGP
jgi:hypothetical protein